MKTKISAVIVTYNGCEYIRKCLRSVLDSTCEMDVTVVDNNSQDETVEVIRRDFPGVRLIGLDENLGFGKANNIGISEAIKDGSDYVLLLNQDAWVLPDTVEHLVNQFRLNAGFGILSPVHWHELLEVLDGGFEKYTNYGLSRTDTDGVCAVKFVNAAVWLVPASVFRRIGGFDPMFFHCGEDVDFVNRLRYYGYGIGYCPNAHAVHDRNQNRVYDKREKLRGIHIYMYVLLKDVNVRFPLSLMKTFYYASSQVVKHPGWSFRILALFAKSVAEGFRICRMRKELRHEGGHFLDLSR